MLDTSGTGGVCGGKASGQGEFWEDTRDRGTERGHIVEWTSQDTRSSMTNGGRQWLGHYGRKLSP